MYTPISQSKTEKDKTKTSGYIPIGQNQTTSKTNPIDIVNNLKNQNLSIGSAKTSIGNKIVDKLPTFLKLGVETFKQGLIGEGQVSDLAGNIKFSGGILRRGNTFESNTLDTIVPFRLLLPKSDEEKALTRLDLLRPLIEDGTITPQRADDIARNSIHNTILEQAKGAVKQKDLNLTKEEKQALRPAFLNEALDKVFGSLDVISFGTLKPLEKVVAEKIAKSKSVEEIFGLLKKQFTTITDETADIMSRALVNIDNIDDVQTVINRTEYAINGVNKAYKPIVQTEKGVGSKIADNSTIDIPEKISNLLLDKNISKIEGLELGSDEFMGASVLASNLRKYFDKEVFPFAGKTRFASESSLDNIKDIFDKKITNYIRRFDSESERKGAEIAFNYWKNEIDKLTKPVNKEAGMQVADNLSQEARKYKSAEEFRESITKNFTADLPLDTKLTFKNLYIDDYNKGYVKGQENNPAIFYRGGTTLKPNSKGNIWLTGDESGALAYSEDFTKPSMDKVSSAVVKSKKPFLLKTSSGSGLSKEVESNFKKIGIEPSDWDINNPEMKNKAIKYAKDNGYDSIYFDDSSIDGVTPIDSLVVFNEDNIIYLKTGKQVEKPKSQLTDIWKQANKKPKAELPEELQQKKLAIEIKKEVLSENPAKELMKYANKRTMELPEVLGYGKSIFGKEGDQLVTELGFTDSEQAREAFQKYLSDRENLKQAEAELKFAIKEHKSQVILDKIGERITKHQEKMIEFANKYPKLTSLIINMSKESSEGAIKGYKLGVSETSKELKKVMKDMKSEQRVDISLVQKRLTDIIKNSNLDQADKGKFLSSIKNIQTEKQLEKIIPKIQERISLLGEASLKRSITNKINKELSTTKPIKQGQIKVGKYDYESNKFFNEIRNYNKLSQDKAEIELSNMPTENLSQMDKIKTRFLSYKVNGAKSSLALQTQVLADIQDLKEMGEIAKSEADFIKLLNKEQKIIEVLDGINAQKPSKKILKTLKTAYISTVGNLYSDINAIAGKNIADKFDYGVFQTNTEYAFSNKVDLATDKAKNIYAVKSDKELTKIFTNELAPKDYKITGADGFTEDINKFDLMNIYNGIKNDLRKKQFYNHFGETQVNSLLQNLTEEDIKMADYLMEEVQTYKEVLNQRSIEIFGRDIGMVENYWPSKSEFQKDFFDGIVRQSEIPSAIKERAKGSKVIPKMDNAWLNFQRHIAQAEHTRTLSPIYEELKRVFSDSRIEKTIRQKYGDKAYDSLMNNIETFSLNKISQKLDVFSGIYNTALNNWVKAKITSPTVFARQLISSVYSIEKVGTKDFIKYQTEVVSNPVQSFKFMWDNVPFIKTRFNKGYSEALQDVIRGTSALKIGMGNITKYTSLLTRGGDITAIILNGYPIIKSDLAKGMKLEDALLDFQKFTEKTQQSGSLANLSSLQRDRNAFARTFLRFKNTLNQLLRLQVDANIQFINKQITGSEFAKKTFLYSIYTPIMYTLIGFAIGEGYKEIFGQNDKGKAEELPGDILQQTILQPFQTIPLLDATFESAYSELRKRTTGKDYYYGDGLFSYPLLDDITDAWNKIKKEEPTAYDWLTVFSKLQEPATGLPTETVLRYLRYSGIGGNKKSKDSSSGLPKLPSLKNTLPKLPSLPKL